MQLLYIHFPKAGGSSIRSQLMEHFAEKAFADYDHDPIGGNDVITKAVPPHDTECVFGHLHPGRYADWADRMFTILREPVENLLSIYFFWLDFPVSENPIHKKFVTEKPSVLEFAEHYPIRYLMTRHYFRNFDMNRFDFIGFNDLRTESLEKISLLAENELKASVHINKTGEQHRQSRQEIMAHKKVLSDLRSFLKNDIEFYEKLRAKWA